MPVNHNAPVAGLAGEVYHLAAVQRYYGSGTVTTVKGGVYLLQQPGKLAGRLQAWCAPNAESARGRQTIDACRRLQTQHHDAAPLK
eukprot:6178973-Pleurochrysis_carterae.AAC.1